MDHFKLYTKRDLESLTNERIGEQKLGQTVQSIADLSQLAESTAKFVVLGIPEDIGVRANHGVGGADTAWAPAIKALLNTQSNAFLDGDEILVLGHFEIEQPKDASIASLREKTAQIDNLVAPVIEAVVAANKIPIVVGGGHNNALPIISGVVKALQKAIAVVNIDAHADLRDTAEGRHSGNPFSNALEKGLLTSYNVFGLHQNYLNNQLLPELNKGHIRAAFYDDLLQSDVPNSENFKNFTADLQQPCGLEIDLDSIANMLASAVSPTGFTLDDIRKIILQFDKNYAYLHICEGAYQLKNGQTQETIGKAIAYLITDFIKALPPRTYPQP